MECILFGTISSMPYNSLQPLFFILNPPMPRVVPQHVPFVPLQDQLLWKKDHRFQELPKAKAREAVNTRIRHLVIDLAGTLPAGPYPPHHNDHPVSMPLIGIGQQNYKRIGSYYVIVSNSFNDLLLLGTQNALVSAPCQQ